MRTPVSFLMTMTPWIRFRLNAIFIQCDIITETRVVAGGRKGRPYGPGDPTISMP